MSYTALYRKWRPARFSEVKGQDAIITTLKNEILSGRIGHAYLFCGTRGTGKTSVAKIFARAVNCEAPEAGEPCGGCAMCKAAESGASVNVIELDAASNNGVDNVREIREEVQYPPSEGRYRVYIIDEVHMLSAAAFNALLKTLEEPPSYVIFVLATTEPHKIPATILSRCQQFHFHRIGPEVIGERLREICRQEGAEAEDEALRYIVRKADGAMRDAISLLDQAIAFHPGQTLTYERALNALGAVDNETFSGFVRCLAENRVTELLGQIETVVMSGKELGQFTQDLVWYLRNLLLVQTAPVSNEMLEAGAEDRQRLEEESRMFTQEQVIRLIRIFSEVYNRMRQAVNKRVLLEVAAIRAMEPELERNTDALEARLAILEQKVKNGIPAAAAPVMAAEPAAPAKTRSIAVSREAFQDWSRLKEDWPSFLEKLDHPARQMLRRGSLEPREEGRLIIALPRGDADIIRSWDTLTLLEQDIGEAYGKAIRLEVRQKAADEPEPEFTVADVEAVFQGMNITAEEADDGWTLDKGED